MSDRYIKESDIVKMCEEAAETCHKLYMESLHMATEKYEDELYERLTIARVKGGEDGKHEQEL